MSVFFIAVPTREHELYLRQKEAHIQDTKVVETRSVTSTATNSDRKSEFVYQATDTKNKKLKIIVADDYMEIKDSKENKKKSSDSGKDHQETAIIRAEIEKYYLEKHLEEALSAFPVYCVTWSKSQSGTYSQVHFLVPRSITDQLIRRLQSVQIGTKYESILSVCTTDFYYGPTHAESERVDENEEDELKNSKWQEFIKSIKARLTVAQVVTQIQAMAVLTFDFLMLAFVAATISFLGLIENSSVTLVASMLISPLMGPIMAFTFGAVIRDKSLIKAGLASEGIGLLICLTVGFCFGMVLAGGSGGPWNSALIWPTPEMTSRGTPRSLVIGAYIAIPSGIGVALSILAGNAGSLVGVAIAASLLPPAVNCGLFFGSAFIIAVKHTSKMHWNCSQNLSISSVDDYHYTNRHKSVYCVNVFREFVSLGACSLVLTVINILVIILVAIVILKIKEVAPYTSRKALHRFWKEDLAYTRKYNTQHAGNTKEELLADIQKASHGKLVSRDLRNDTVIRTINRRFGNGQETAVLDQATASRTDAKSKLQLPRKAMVDKSKSFKGPAPKAGWLRLSPWSNKPG